MKFKTFLSYIPIFLVSLISLFVGCTRINTTPVPNPTWPPQTIWSNGTIGFWFGNVLTGNSGGCCPSTSSISSATDNISGDTNTLLLSTTYTHGFYFYSASTPSNPSSYYAKGHLQFDIRLEQPPSLFTLLYVEYLLQANSDNGAVTFNPNFINSLSTTSFTHVSLPFSTFTPDYEAQSIDTPFEISWQTTSAPSNGNVVTLDDIVWTAN